VAWGVAKGSTQPVNLQVEVEDRRGLLAEITSRISDAKTNIRHINSRIESHRGRINLIIDVADVDHLRRITLLLSKIPGVLGVVRTGTR
jgi:(p)ppGpp synthase/HD superfamily hydrolase